MRQGRELNIAWRVNSNVLTSITTNERQELYKAVCKKDIQERIVQLLHPLSFQSIVEGLTRSNVAKPPMEKIGLIAIC